jgi:hypothetical protein
MYRDLSSIAPSDHIEATGTMQSHVSTRRQFCFPLPLTTHSIIQTKVSTTRQSQETEQHLFPTQNDCPDFASTTIQVQLHIIDYF